MTKQPNTAYAKSLGAIAFANGMPSSPALSKEMMDMMIGRVVGDKRSIPEMKAFSSGWHQANIAANS